MIHNVCRIIKKMDIESHQCTFDEWFPPKSQKRYLCTRGSMCIGIVSSILLSVSFFYFGGMGIGYLIFKENDPLFLWFLGPLAGGSILLECCVLVVGTLYVGTLCAICIYADQDHYFLK